MFGLKYLMKFLVGRDYDNVIVEKCKNLQTVPTFFNSKSQVHIKVREINDYRCMSITLVCDNIVFTVSPIALEFKSKDASHTVYSEYEYVEGDYSPSAKICLTKFDVEFTPMLDSFLAKEKLEAMTIRIPNGLEHDGTYLIELDQINREELKKLYKN